jgi:adenylyltransferase/sulfurtransferase
MSPSWSADELARYARHFSLSGFGPQAQEKLRRARVLVIGCGGLGCPATQYLAAAGVGHITMVDSDRVELSNLQRQILFTTQDVGQLKVVAAARRLQALNPWVSIITKPERFNRDNALALVRDCDVLIDGSDNFATRYLVNDACVIEGKPFVYGAIQGFEGQASVFNWQQGPTYRCLFPRDEQAITAPNCSEAGVLGVLPGLIGTVQATEAIKLITGIGESLSGRLLLWDALTMRMRTLTLQGDPRRHEITQLPDDPEGPRCASPAGPGQLNDEADEITASELRTTLSQWQLVDVRADWERATGTILPSMHLPLAELETAETLPLNPTKPTVAFCGTGIRSLRALTLLRQRHGLTQVRSLRGGYQAWSDAVAA